ncbi:myb-related transcription factor, partner of profilin-like [Rhinatrema bivittatum]|uniref:myb-related transcription factor, partner of profilin-like n=1 Tax=Rhinatrema bivittatum TaxID=194408 RepID=UPI001125F35E|nr:myb-related transcription factor, partner of profilin-like [Rhinatrema bivittatum]
MRFSAEDNDLLIEGVLHHYAHLFGNLAVKTSKAAKGQIWATIAGDITRQSDIPRTGEQVAHRYRDIKAQLKQKIAERNQYMRDTGGRSPYPIRFTEMERRLMQRLGPDVFEGLDPRLDTSHLEDEHSGPRQQMSGATWEGPGTSRDPQGTRWPPMMTRPFHLDATTQWSDVEEEEEVRPTGAATGSPLTLSEALEDIVWGTSPTDLHPMSLEGTPPTPVMSPCSPAPAPGAAMPIPHPPAPQAPPAAPPLQQNIDPMTATQAEQIMMELRGVRRAIRQQGRDSQLQTAAITQAGNIIAAAIGTLNTILLQMLQRMPDQQPSSSSTTSTPQPSPSGTRGHRGRPPQEPATSHRTIRMWQGALRGPSGTTIRFLYLQAFLEGHHVDGTYTLPTERDGCIYVTQRDM